MKQQRIVWLLGACLVGALAFMWNQHRSIVAMESQLGEYWSNGFSGSYFSRLGDLAEVLDRLAEGRPLQPGERDRLLHLSSGAASTINNTLQDVRQIRPDAPDARHLVGYLVAIESSALRIRPDATTLEPYVQEEFERHRALMADFLQLMPKHFPEFQPDGGLTSSDAYWGRNFLSDQGWRAAISEMDRLAEKAHYHFP